MASELSDDEFFKVYARNRALGKIMNETRVGEVDGIRFNLRHSKINPDEWGMDLLGGDDGNPPRRSDLLPFIWFPWYGEFSLDKVKAEVAAEYQETRESEPQPREVFQDIADTEYEKHVKEHNKQRRIPKSWIKEEVKLRTPDTIVSFGDCITTDRVVMNIYGDELDPLHDRELKSIYLLKSSPKLVNAIFLKNQLF
jgi:hypothetical protein